jgi:hypothetical protein
MKNNFPHWFNWHHLRDAEGHSKKHKNGVTLYFGHMYVGFREAGYQLLLAVASILHAIFPPLFDFKLLDVVINQTIGLHKYLPKHPGWKKLKDELDKNTKE